MKLHRFIAIDQHAQVHGPFGGNVRQELLAYFNRKHADIVYQDLRDGQTIRKGYVIARLWLNVYELINPWKKAK